MEVQRQIRLETDPRIGVNHEYATGILGLGKVLDELQALPALAIYRAQHQGVYGGCPEQVEITQDKPS
jgi:hypothetical protein